MLTSLVSFSVGLCLQGCYFVMLARTLGPQEFGRFAGALAFASILSTVAGFGSGNVLVMWVSQNPQVFRTQFGTALVYICGGFPVLALIGVFAVEFTNPAIFSVVLPLLISELIFTRLLDLGQQSFQSHDRLKGTASINISAGATRLASVVVFSGGILPPVAATWAVVYASCSLFVGCIAVALCTYNFGAPTFNWLSLAVTWRTGIYFAMGMSSRVLYSDGDKYVLNSFGQEASAGYYAAGSRIATMAFVPIQAAVYSSNTRMYRLARDGPRALWSLTRRLLAGVVVYGFTVALIFIVGGRVLPLLLGGDFAEVTEVMIWLSPLVCLQGIHYLFGDSMMALGRQRLRSLGQLSIALISIVLNIALVPSFGWRASAMIALVSAAGLAALMAAAFAHAFSVERK